MAITKIKADGLTADLIDETKLADNSIDSEHYNDGSIDNAHLADNAVGTAEIAADAVTGAKIADDAIGAEHIEVLDANLQFGDSVKAQFGTGTDLGIWHDGSHSYIQNTTGELYIQPKSGENAIKAVADGAVSLFHDDTVRLATNANGVEVNGHVWLGDGEHVKFGAGTNGDLQIYHNGTNDFIQSNGGYLKVQTDSLKIHDRSDDHPMIEAVNDGAVNLYYDNAKKLSTTSTGAKVESSSNTTLHLTSSTSSSASIEFGDTDDDDEAEIWYDNYSKKLNFRTTEASDLVFYRDGTEKNRITSDGLTFNGDTAAANALDDYEEGTWTPTGNGFPTISNAHGKYMRVGRIVHAWWQMSFASDGSNSHAHITSLPFTAENNGPYAGGTAWDYRTSSNVNAHISGGTTILYWYTEVGNNCNGDDSRIEGKQFRACTTYRAAS